MMGSLLRQGFGGRRREKGRAGEKSVQLCETQCDSVVKVVLMKISLLLCNPALLVSECFRKELLL